MFLMAEMAETADGQEIRIALGGENPNATCTYTKARLYPNLGFKHGTHLCMCSYIF
jgi:hypothetical protein